MTTYLGVLDCIGQQVEQDLIKAQVIGNQELMLDMLELNLKGLLLGARLRTHNGI